MGVCMYYLLDYGGYDQHIYEFVNDKLSLIVSWVGLYMNGYVNPSAKYNVIWWPIFDNCLKRFRI